ncbi:hypothetical protein J6590_027019 [Homalodisca vitripennis]|nr:hypothetical protein J6590_027019 [Homalodisca vitripennis]
MKWRIAAVSTPLAIRSRYTDSLILLQLLCCGATESSASSNVSRVASSSTTVFVLMYQQLLCLPHLPFGQDIRTRLYCYSSCVVVPQNHRLAPMCRGWPVQSSASSNVSRVASSSTTVFVLMYQQLLCLSHLPFGQDVRTRLYCYTSCVVVPQYHRLAPTCRGWQFIDHSVCLNISTVAVSIPLAIRSRCTDSLILLQLLCCGATESSASSNVSRVANHRLAPTCRGWQFVDHSVCLNVSTAAVSTPLAIRSRYTDSLILLQLLCCGATESSACYNVSRVAVRRPQCLS